MLYKGDTVFKPPEWEFRLEPVVSINHVEVPERALLGAVAAAPLTRTRSTLGLQAAFVDRHLRNVSSRYDFDSIRIGIQPMTADFRGFLFNDAPLGVRLFGIRANNRYQYNLGWFRRLEKDVNSGLNDVFRHGGAALRHDDVLLANLYAQDTPRPGFTSQACEVNPGRGVSWAYRFASRTSSWRSAAPPWRNTSLSPEFTSFSSRRNQPRLYW